jgi:hypothetical protein
MISEITAKMHQLEKLIQYFNKKYDYEIEEATKKDKSEWNLALELWDTMKRKRDLIKQGGLK